MYTIASTLYTDKAFFSLYKHHTFTGLHVYLHFLTRRFHVFGSYARIRFLTMTPTSPSNTSCSNLLILVSLIWFLRRILIVVQHGPFHAVFHLWKPIRNMFCSSPAKFLWICLCTTPADLIHGIHYGPWLAASSVIFGHMLVYFFVVRSVHPIR